MYKYMDMIIVLLITPIDIICKLWRSISFLKHASRILLPSRDTLHIDDLKIVMTILIVLQ